MRIFSTIVAALAIAAPAVPAAAQELLGTYYGMVDHADMRNSRGVQLSNACAILQQERANFHRFGIRQPGDGGDPWFGNQEARSVIGRACTFAPGHEYVGQWIATGRPRAIWVQVFGYNGWPSYVVVREGAG